MHVLLTDETNMQAGEGTKFFAYGGLFFPVERLVDLDTGIHRIRERLGYQPGDMLKFDTNARPSHITADEATEAKRQVIQLCLDLDCQFIVYVILHDILRGQDEQIQYAFNSVLARFNKYLRSVGDQGIVVADAPPVSRPWGLLSETFSFGLNFGDRRVALERIKLLAASCLNASHAMSAMDIVLGSFRYCINDPANPDAARAMMPDIVRLMWHHYDSERDTYYVGTRGFIARPIMENIRVPDYREEYEALVAHVKNLLREEEEELE